MELVERLRAEANACEVAALALVGRSKARMLHRARLFTEAADLLEEALKALAGIAPTLRAQQAAGIRWDPQQVDAVFAILTKSQGEKIDG